MIKVLRKRFNRYQRVKEILISRRNTKNHSKIIRKVLLKGQNSQKKKILLVIL